MIAGMITWAMLKGGASLLVAIPAALLLGAVLSYGVERVTYRQMRGGDHFVPLVSSMAFLILLENLVLVAWGSDQQRLVLPFQSVSARIGRPRHRPAAARRARAGRGGGVDARPRPQAHAHRPGLRSIAEDAETATMLGVSVGRVVPLVFVIGGVFTALAGVLFSLNYQQASPFMGEEVALKGISAMVIGGMGNIWGAILGGLVIGVVETAAIHWFGARAVDIWVYGMLLAILFVRPTGLLGGGLARGRA